MLAICRARVAAGRRLITWNATQASSVATIAAAEHAELGLLERLALEGEASRSAARP